MNGKFTKLTHALRYKMRNDHDDVPVTTSTNNSRKVSNCTSCFFNTRVSKAYSLLQFIAQLVSNVCTSLWSFFRFKYLPINAYNLYSFLVLLWKYWVNECQYSYSQGNALKVSSKRTGYKIKLPSVTVNCYILYHYLLLVIQ